MILTTGYFLTRSSVCSIKRTLFYLLKRNTESTNKLRPYLQCSKKNKLVKKNAIQEDKGAGERYT